MIMNSELVNMGMNWQWPINIKLCVTGRILPKVMSKDTKTFGTVGSRTPYLPSVVPTLAFINTRRCKSRAVSWCNRNLRLLKVDRKNLLCTQFQGSGSSLG